MTRQIRYVHVPPVLFEKAHRFQRVLPGKAVVLEQFPRCNVGDRRPLIGNDEAVGDAELLQARHNGRQSPPRTDGKHAARRAVTGDRTFVRFRDRPVRADERPVKIG